MDELARPETAGTPASPWSQNPRTLLLVAAAAFVLIGLITLAASIDLPTSETADDAPEFTADQRNGSGFSGDGRIDLGDNTGVDIRPIPGCPDGFAIGEDIYVVPDPEACGFRPIAPGERGFDPNGKILLVPSEDGDVGGMRIGPDGAVELLPPGMLGPDDFAIGQLPDGSFGLVRPNGSRVDIVPGDDGLSLRDRAGGGSQFVPGDGFGQNGNNGLGGQNGQNGSNGQGGQNAPFDSAQPPGAFQPGDDDPSQQDSSRNDDDQGTDWSFLGPLLLVVVVLAVVGFLIMALRNSDWRPSRNDEDEPDHDAPQDTLVDYSAEIDALDRMLWEIDQEPDPRTAIRRVYAALETGLDNPAMARKRSETPGMYLGRILGRFTQLDGQLHELTGLFEQARFSEHEITQAMRDRAVTILVEVRGHFAHASMSAEPVLTA